MKEVADASVLVLRANKARSTDYVQLVQMAQPELYLTLQVSYVCLSLKNATPNNGLRVMTRLPFPSSNTDMISPNYSLCLLQILQERKGSRVAVNHGQGGIAISGYFVGPIKFERPGPIANDPLNRAVQLQPAAKCRIDTKNTGKLLAPMQSHLPFSIEGWAKCEGGLDTARYVLMTGRSV